MRMYLQTEATKWVYLFSEGSKEMTGLLGGKGANLAEMSRLGMPVPNGFIITTEACLDYLEKKALSFSLKEQIEQQIDMLERVTQKKLDDPKRPLLVSIRSGARFSMPGMMDTILNLGMNDQVVEVVAGVTNNAGFAYDCYRRLIQMYGDVVKGVDKNYFETVLTHYKNQKNYLMDTELMDEDWKEITRQFKKVYYSHLGEGFPQDPKEQLYGAVEAVFHSWNNPRAKIYRKMNGISDDLGTAVTVQEMVFGNSGMKSGTGVAFTRNPSTGETGLFGEFLMNAQGEDVVAGIRTPKEISELKQIMPETYDQFTEIAEKLEKHYEDMQDIEFTIENGKLFILQTRNGKRTSKAAVEIVLDLVEEGVISKEEGLMRLTPSMMDQLLHPTFVASELVKYSPLVQGLPASPGSASGKVYFTAEAAKEANAAGDKTILLRNETSPEDIEGMAISEAIVTARGGMTSHAAVVARGMGACCVVGCDQLVIDEQQRKAYTNGQEILEGTLISVNGSTGKVYLGEIAKENHGGGSSTLSKIVQWCKELSDVRVKANAETGKEIAASLELGGEGMGLVRTEHMFFGEKRILEMRKMILEDDEQAKIKALTNLKEFQKEDFKTIFSLANGKSAIIRLLDPPLHEFLPNEKEIPTVAEVLGISVEDLQYRIEGLAENNPMLGHRGCRLAVTDPEIYEMQVEAIMEAAIEVGEEKGIEVVPEIMIPLVSIEKELALIKESLVRKSETIFEKMGKRVSYQIGTMIETPRACLIADKIAEQVDFISFGTNDLTQLTYGFSRDDIGKFVQDYEQKNIMPSDPFQHIDVDGVGVLLHEAIQKIKATSKKVSIGICGEVGGDPESIQFLLKEGVDYVSCSPYRIPAALLTIAQQRIKGI